MKWETATFCSHSIFTLLSSSILLKQESPVLWSSAVLPQLAAIAQWQSTCLVTDCDLGKQEVMSSNLIGSFNFISDHIHHSKNSEASELSDWVAFFKGLVVDFDWWGYREDNDID